MYCLFVWIYRVIFVLVLFASCCMPENCNSSIQHHLHTKGRNCYTLAKQWSYKSNNRLNIEHKDDHIQQIKSPNNSSTWLRTYNSKNRISNLKWWENESLFWCLFFYRLTCMNVVLPFHNQFNSLCPRRTGDIAFHIVLDWVVPLQLITEYVYTIDSTIKFHFFIP